MPIYLMSGRLLMKSEKRLNLDSYFEFLNSYFTIFNIGQVKRKKISGKNFKL